MPTEIPVEEDETFDEFAARVKVSREQLFDLNEAKLTANGATKQNLGRPLFFRKDWLANPTKITTLTVPDSGAEDPVSKPRPEPAPEPLHGLENPQFHWLTYETLFNQRPYRKTNQRCDAGIYGIKLDRVKVFVRNDIETNVLNELCAAFFPDVKADHIESLSIADWPWKPKKASPWVFEPYSADAVVANRGNNILFTKQYALLPINIVDNDPSSHAIGVKNKADFGADLIKLNKTWHLWKTASRSSIMRLAPVKKKGDPWQPLRVSDFNWSFPLQKVPSHEDFGKFERETNLQDAAGQNNAFDLASSDNCFSVKTGVVWVGNVNQQGVHKDKLEENSIVACLRSDLIVELDKKAGRNHKTDRDIVIQTELLSITERDTAKPDNKERFGDGVQVRDLSVLDKNKIYIPPISIPFLDTTLSNLRRRFQNIGGADWCEFWKNNYAVSVGKTKAILLLRYGMQMGSPNAQNFLIEFNKPASPGGVPTATGRIVIRDVGDAYLHREVLWARLGGKGLPPQEVADRTKLKTLNSKIIQYECNELAEEWEWMPQETGSLYEASYGPRGTRFLWHRFSTLSKGSSVDSASKMGTDPDAYSKGWRQVLKTMCEWGIAHNQAYVKYLEETLALRFNINWLEAPKPERYTSLAETDKQGAGNHYKEDLQWEDEAANKVHDVLKSQQGQDKLKAII